MTRAYKLTVLLTRRPDLAPEQFVEEWLALERRDPLEAQGLERYSVIRPLAGDSPIKGAQPAPYDAIVETWWARKNDAADWVISRDFEDAWLPPRLALLAERPAAIGGEPVVVWERTETAGMVPVTVTVLPVSLRTLRVDDFIEHWVGAHARLALAGPGAEDRLVRLEDTPSKVAPPSRFAKTRYDGVGAVTFASVDALRDEFDSDYYRDVMAPDELKFTDPAMSHVLVGERIDLG